MKMKEDGYTWKDLDRSYWEGFDNAKNKMEKRIVELEKELEKERNLNAEIKARFVKCNTCTDEMKSKCLMFSENLCEGERCEELVDLMALVSKSDLQKENEQLKEQIEKMKCCENCDWSNYLPNGNCLDCDGKKNWKFKEIKEND